MTSLGIITNSSHLFEYRTRPCCSLWIKTCNIHFKSTTHYTFLVRLPLKELQSSSFVGHLLRTFIPGLITLIILLINGWSNDQKGIEGIISLQLLGTLASLTLFYGIGLCFVEPLLAGFDHDNNQTGIAMVFICVFNCCQYGCIAKYCCRPCKAYQKCSKHSNL